MIVIEGAVGAGKSTLLELFEEKGYKAFREPVLENPILDKFYQDKERYSFAAQVFFWTSRINHLREVSKYKNVVLDRSIYGDDIFAKILKEEGSLSDIEYGILNELKSTFESEVISPNLMIYLEIDTDEAIRRVKRRGRSCEQDVSFEYWDKINKSYDSFFKEYNKSRLLKINVSNLDFLNVNEDRIHVWNLIKKEIDLIKGSVN